jgi:hypothetical protein
MPIFYESGQKDKPDAVAVCELRSFDLTAEDDQLLSKESIFNYQIGFASG